MRTDLLSQHLVSSHVCVLWCGVVWCVVVCCVAHLAAAVCAVLVLPFVCVRVFIIMSLSVTAIRGWGCHLL